jgi:hypothetical protein
LSGPFLNGMLEESFESTMEILGLLDVALGIFQSIFVCK